MERVDEEEPVYGVPHPVIEKMYRLWYGCWYMERAMLEYRARQVLGDREEKEEKE